jgi:hypothetical protein
MPRRHERITGADVPRWDSLSHINKIIAAEKSLGSILASRTPAISKTSET